MHPNPYVGPRAFRSGETLHGRDREVLELLDLLISERIVLLHSPSGAGKTSLIQAALVPELKKEDFEVLPVMRVSSEPSPQERQGVEIRNRYALSVMLMLEKELPPEKRTPLSELAQIQLKEYLTKHLAAREEQKNVVLIFDQFEEIITIDQTDRKAKEEFFEQVGALLRNPKCWAIFAMREDYVASLEPYLRKLPTRLSNTSPLDLLGVAAALNAIQKPSKERGVIFEDDAAQKLVDDLRTIRVQQPDGTMQEQPGQHVEPVHLQVVCYQLWDKLPDNTSVITINNIRKSGDVSSALAGYYAERVKEVALKEKVSERSIRSWFNNALITEHGIRGQVLHTPTISQGLEDRAIWPLIDAHLVRAEKRRSATWFELAHDRLIAPIQADNAEWLEKNLQPFQRQAELWERQKRAEGLLLHGAALVEAEKWAQANDAKLTPVERDFLSKCREARTHAEEEQKRLKEQAEHDRKQLQRFRRLAYLTTAISILSVSLFVWGLFTSKALAKEKNKVDKAREEVANAYDKLESTYKALRTTSMDRDQTLLKLEGTLTERDIAITDLKKVRDDLQVQRDKAIEAKKEALKQTKIASDNYEKAKKANERDKKNTEGIQAYQMEDMHTAKDSFVRARELYKEDNDQAGVAWAHSNIGLSLSRLGQHKEAIESYQEAIKSYKKALPLLQAAGKGPREKLFILDNLARLNDELVNYNEAAEYSKEALKIREAASAPNMPAVAANYDRLAGIYLKQSERSKALEAYRKALDARIQALGAKSLPVAETYDKLGHTYREMFVYSDAEENYKKALEIRQEVLPAEHEDIVTNLNALIGLYNQMSKRFEADQLSEAIRKIRFITRGPDSAFNAEGLFELAAVYAKHEGLKKSLGEPFNYANTIRLYERAIGMEEKLNTADVYLVRQYNKVARFYNGIGMYDKAARYFLLEADLRRNIVERQGADDQIANAEKEKSKGDFIDSLLSLAFSYKNIGRHQDAEPLLAEALKVAETLLARDLPRLGENINPLDKSEVAAREVIAMRAKWQADLYYSSQRYAEAEGLFQRVVAFWQKLIGPEKRLEYSKTIFLPPGSHSDATKELISAAFVNLDGYMGALSGLTATYLMLGKNAEAEALYKETVATLEWYEKAFMEGNNRTDWPSMSNPYIRHETRVTAANCPAETVNCINSHYYNTLASVYESYAKFLRDKNAGRAEEAEFLSAKAAIARLAQRLQKTPPCY